MCWLLVSENGRLGQAGGRGSELADLGCFGWIFCSPLVQPYKLAFFVVTPMQTCADRGRPAILHEPGRPQCITTQRRAVLLRQFPASPQSSRKGNACFLQLRLRVVASCRRGVFVVCIALHVLGERRSRGANWERGRSCELQWGCVK